MSYNFIWDLDGTIIDSYGMMVKALHQMAEENGVIDEPFAIKKLIINGFVADYFNKLWDEHGIPVEIQRKRYNELSNTFWHEITPMEGVFDCLEALKEGGCRNFIFTHRGKLTHDILDYLKLSGYFEETVTSEAHLPWKPAPDGAKYFVDKYALDPGTTFYVGDRTIDVDCGFNAGIKSIFFREEGSLVPITGHETYIVKKLVEIPELFGFRLKNK